MDDGRRECDDLPQLVEEASTASMEDLPMEARQSVSEACQEAGIDLRVMRDGYRHVTPEPLLDPKADAELLAELAELERMMRGVGGFEDVQGEHCNQQHIDGCPNRFKQHDNRHAREGKTKPRKHRNRELKEPTVQEYETFHVSAPVETEAAFEERAVRLKKNYGKPGRGFQAPGMKEEFFVSGNVVEELRSGKHIRRSADKVSHLTAADNIDYLWERSYPFKKYRDKEKVFEKSTIEWMYKRLAYMDLRGKRYEVEITAKAFKRDVNILYQVKTRAIK